MNCEETKLSTVVKKLKMNKINEVAQTQPGQETSNFTGHNDQMHVPSNKLEYLQQSVLSSADGAPPFHIGGAIGVGIPSVLQHNSPPDNTPINNTSKTNLVFGLTPLQAGLGAAGIITVVTLVILGIKHYKKSKV